MKIEKAIELKRIYINEHRNDFTPDELPCEVMALGALQLVYDRRHKIGIYYHDTLPGEEEEK